MVGEFNQMLQIRKLFTNIIIQRTCPVALYVKLSMPESISFKFNFHPLTLIYISETHIHTCIIYLSSGFTNSQQLLAITH